MQGVTRYFEKRYKYIADYVPQFDDIVAERNDDLDKQLAASGYTQKKAAAFDKVSTLLCQRLFENVTVSNHHQKKLLVFRQAINDDAP